jgi:hypothetical protein
VSGNRKRYQDETFDLDLSYVTPRCIAMAFPGQDTVGPFSTALRNDMKDVRRFFEEKHRGCYMIFNLCAEKSYDAANFNGMFEHIPFLDHNPPTLRQLKHFCNVATRWCLQRHNNVVAVHCKGGKGRTGVMVACWLLADAHNEGKPMTYQEAIDKFIEGRTQVRMPCIPSLQSAVCSCFEECSMVRNYSILQCAGISFLFCAHAHSQQGEVRARFGRKQYGLRFF